MNCLSVRYAWLAALGLWLHVSAVSASDYDLFGVHFDTGDIYGLSTADASVTPLGSTGIPRVGSLELGPDGTLYGFTAGLIDDPLPPTLFSFDLDTFAPTVIGPLNRPSIFDGSLVFAPDGNVYGTNAGFVLNPQLFTLDINTGVATVIGTISVGLDTQHDINAMAWRSDGMLVGLDRVTNALLAIDPSDASASVIATLALTGGGDVGGVGGMAIIGDDGYFVTAGPGHIIPGTNELYRFDLFTGDTELVGSLSPTITGRGISGLAVVPEPATLVLVGLGAAALLRRRQRA